MSQVQAYDPPLPRAVRAFALVQITMAILGSMLLLWYAEELSGLPLVAGALAVIAMLWLTGAVMQSRLRMSPAVAVELTMVGIAIFAIGAARPGLALT